MSRAPVHFHLLSVDSPGYIDEVLRQMAANVEYVNRANGWYDDERTFGDDIALLHSEISEAFEAYRDWGFRDKTPSEYEWGSQPDPDYAPYRPKPEGVGSELADVLIRLLDTAKRHGINLAEEYRRKMQYNRTRGYRHGGKRL